VRLYLKRKPKKKEINMQPKKTSFDTDMTRAILRSQTSIFGQVFSAAIAKSMSLWKVSQG
jgi:hypothetical protein